MNSWKIFLAVALILFSLVFLVSADRIFGEDNIIIPVSHAEHLGSRGNFISDIYEEVRHLDNIWSEEIPDNNYVRVIFEENLTNKNDITVYARKISGNPDLKVYEKDSYEGVADFGEINEDNKYRILLTNLADDYSQDTFDLKVVGGSVQFDYIVDPSNQTDNVSTYNNVSDVYIDFIWDYSNILMQAKSCDDSACDIEGFVGPDGTANTWYSNFSFNDINVSSNRYFQFLAYLWINVTDDGRINESFSPTLKNVSIGIFNSTAPYLNQPDITADSSGETFLNCSTKAWTVNPQVNVSFVWYIDDNFYKNESVSLTSGAVASSVINSTEIVTSRMWNCSVQAYDGAYSESKMAWEASVNYDSMSSVYDSFIWYGNNIQMQVRSCADSICSAGYFIGAENTTSSWMMAPEEGNLSLTNLSAGRYFQYRANFFRNIFGTTWGAIAELSPRLFEVDIGTSSDIGIVNFWNCSGATVKNFTDTSCWSLGRIPQAYDDVIFNSSGTAPCNITSNSMPQNLNSFTVDTTYSGTIYFQPLFAQGTWGANPGTQMWNVTNNIIINSGTMKIYGDYVSVSCCNISYDGHGQEWTSLNGNITVGTNGIIDGSGLGFAGAIGPGAGGNYIGGTYGGKGGGNTKATYGSETWPTSLGSGLYFSGTANGGGAIKISASNINLNGTINVMGNTMYAGASGGSVWINSSNSFSGSGSINASGSAGLRVGDGTGGGGRVAIYSNNYNFSGQINNLGGNWANGSLPGSGGTVYINATTIYSTGNISVAGYNGTVGGTDWGQRINISATTITLRGIYNASRLNVSDTSVKDGTITLNFTSCASSFTSAVFAGRLINQGNSSCNNFSVALISPANATYSNNSANNFTANISGNIFGIANATLNIFNTNGNKWLEFDGGNDWVKIGRTCQEGMVYINKLNGFCIDKYEASVWNADGTWNSTSNTSAWSSATATQTAIRNGAYANSTAGVYPWVYVNQTDARLACTRAGKYLCTSEEWLAAANINGQVYNLPSGADTANKIPAGSTDGTACVQYEANDCDWADSPGAGDACMTGAHNRCVSAEGVYDMTGNVWEWTNETVAYTKPCTTESEGWCYMNVTQGWSTSGTAKYGSDGVYFSANSVSGKAVLRGGSWGNGAAAGPFAAGLNIAPAGTSAGVGFRCCSVASG